MSHYTVNGTIKTKSQFYDTIIINKLYGEADKTQA